MSSIGSGLAASVAALGSAERAAVTRKATEKRDEAQLREKLRDRFESVDDVNAVVETRQDDESPADDRREKKPDVHAQSDEPGEKPRASLDIQA